MIMILAARCPQCGTAFRIVPDQLKISEGWVRCGQCEHVFDAYDTQYSASKNDLEQEGAAAQPPKEPLVADVQASESIESVNQPVVGTEAALPDFNDTAFGDTLLSEFHIGWADTLIREAEKDTLPVLKSWESLPELDQEKPLALTPFGALSPDAHKRALENIPRTFEELQNKYAQKKSSKDASPDTAYAATPFSPTVQPVEDDPEGVITHIDLMDDDAFGMLPQEQQPGYEQQEGIKGRDTTFTESIVGFSDSLLFDPSEKVVAEEEFDPQAFTEMLSKDPSFEGLFKLAPASKSAPFTKDVSENKGETEPAKAPAFTSHKAPTIAQEYMARINSTSFADSQESNPENGREPDAFNYEGAIFVPSHVSTHSDDGPSNDTLMAIAKNKETFEKISSSLQGQPLSEPSFIKGSQGHDFLGKPAVKAFLALLSLMLIAVLALQVGIAFRDRLATQYPALRPLLTSICEPLNCTVGYPIDLQAITIDAASFDIAADGRYVLELTIRNRSSQTIAIPWVELTLNNASGVTIVRKAFSPEELGVAKVAFKPREELFINQRIIVNAQGIIGKNYSVILFYP